MHNYEKDKMMWNRKKRMLVTRIDLFLNFGIWLVMEEL